MYPIEFKTAAKHIASLALCVILIVIALAVHTSVALAGGETRSISLYFVNTGERLRVTYMIDGKYRLSTMKVINHLFRDRRSNKVITISPRTVDLLWELHSDLGSQQPIHIMSGYRSRELTTIFDEYPCDAECKNQHSAGRAIDFYFPDIPTVHVRNSALVRKVGGVGYYPADSGSTSFIHIDSGPVRYWGPSINASEMTKIMRDYRRTVGARLNKKGMSAVSEVEIARNNLESEKLEVNDTGNSSSNTQPKKKIPLETAYVNDDEDLAGMSEDASTPPQKPKSKTEVDEVKDAEDALVADATEGITQRYPAPMPRAKPIEVQMMSENYMKNGPLVDAGEFASSSEKRAVGPTAGVTNERASQPDNGGIQTNSSKRKIALVIGNSAYEHAPILVNPHSDARAVARTLEDLDFEVIVGLDLSNATTISKVREFAKSAKNADLSLLYYAGHGLQISGENYIVPVDAKVEDETAISFELINIATITNFMGGLDKVGIVLLDACRDNPFSRSLKRTMSASRNMSIDHGLAPLSGGSGGLFVAFATAPGDVAADGEGMKNSPFTTALLKHLPSKGVEINTVMTRVKADVAKMTNNDQRPWTNSDLTTEVYLSSIANNTERRQSQSSEATTVIPLSSEASKKENFKMFSNNIDGNEFNYFVSSLHYKSAPFDYMTNEHIFFHSQLASFKSEVEAKNEYKRLSQAFPDIVDGVNSVVKETNVGGSIRYQLVLGPFSSRQEASEVCSSLISLGESDCIVRGP